jgi:phage-related protein
VKARNKSILIHGFRAKTRRDNVADIETLLRRVADFFLEENEKNAERLAAARFPFLAP